MLDLPKWYRVDNQAATMLRNIKAFSMILGPCLKQQNKTSMISRIMSLSHAPPLLNFETSNVGSLQTVKADWSSIRECWGIHCWHPVCSALSILNHVLVPTLTNVQNKPRIETWPSSMPAIAWGPGSAACTWTSSQAHSTIWNVVKPTTVFSTNAFTLNLHLSFHYRCQLIIRTYSI